MALANQSTVKSAINQLSEILRLLPDLDPNVIVLLSQFEAGLIDLDKKVGAKPTPALAMPTITASVTL